MNFPIENSQISWHAEGSCRLIRTIAQTNNTFLNIRSVRRFCRMGFHWDITRLFHKRFVFPLKTLYSAGKSESFRYEIFADFPGPSGFDLSRYRENYYGYRPDRVSNITYRTRTRSRWWVSIEQKNRDISWYTVPLCSSDWWLCLPRCP